MGQDFRKACYCIWVETILFISFFSHKKTFNLCLRVPKLFVLFNFVSFVGFWQLEEATCEFVIQIFLTLFLKFLLWADARLADMSRAILIEDVSL